ncbi:MAG: hypothetical protein V4498_03250 [candidate division FCPU426 bacterium]
MLLALLAPTGAWGALAGPNPAPRVLIITAANNWNGTEEVDTIKAAMAAMTPAPVVDVCTVTNATGDVATTLAACGTSLANYCQVWDVRFVFQTSGGPYQDNISPATAALYEQFLTDGGRLFVVGETTAFHPRDDGLLQFLNDVSNGAPLAYPSNCKANCCCTTFPSDPLNFNTLPNVLTGMTTSTGDPGLFPFTGIGSGRPLATLAGTGVETLGFLAQDLVTGAGRLMVEMDANFFRYTPASMPPGNTAFIQNAYNWLGSGCDQRLRFTKAASVSAPSTVCLGDNYNYILCVQNIGASTLVAANISDTLPSCVSYVSSSQVPAINSGGYLVWNVGTVPVGGQVCITATVKANSLPPCL